MGSIWGYLKDLTFPFASYFTGENFNFHLYTTFRRRKIEDSWLHLFVITTDLSESMERVHSHGTLWRYIRASMSLCGYLPPLCERDLVTSKLHYLCDGGYVNNLPADVMKSRLGSQATIVAVDVASDWTFSYEHYGDALSGWKVLWHKINPFLKAMTVPTLGDIQSQVSWYLLLNIFA